jgi:hypothetical protein
MGQNDDNTAEELEGNEEEESSLRDDLEASIDDIAEDESKEGSTSMDGLLPDDHVPAKEEAGGEKPDPDASQEAGSEAQGEQSPDEQGEAGHEETKSLKAPVGWPPKAREHWSKLPPEVQAQVAQRETEVEDVIRNTGEARQTHDFIGKLAGNYAPIMAAEGVENPLQAIDGLFKTVAELRMGSPEAKAQRMAAMINHYGIDITALDNALVGNAPQPSENATMQNMIDTSMKPVNELLQNLQNRQQSNRQESVKQAETAVAQFQGEFLADVRNDMADLIDFASAKGQQMSLQDAYDKAVILRPDLQEVLTKRTADEALLGKTNLLQKKRAAGSSLSGRQHSDGRNAGGAMSMRDTLSASWDEQGER